MGDQRYIYDHLKRILDFAGAAILIVFLLPVMGFVALLVYVFMGPPIIFRQDRLTLGGKVFTIYKFRTMTHDAEAKTGAVWASANDPRVTKLGRLMRFTRLDELPQLLNVIEGDMSLIGPRPERPEIAIELVKRMPSFNKRLEVKAGLTGLAQIEAGYSSSIESYRRKLALDIIYIRKRSLFLDLAIAVRTIVVVITGRGAR